MIVSRARGGIQTTGFISHGGEFDWGLPALGPGAPPAPSDGRSRRCDLACRTSMGAFWGLRYCRWEVGHLGLVVCWVKLLKGGWPTTKRAHALAAPCTKTDHDVHGGPATCVHTFINTKVTVSLFVEVCTQLTCRCKTSDGHLCTNVVHAFTQNMEVVVRA